MFRLPFTTTSFLDLPFPIYLYEHPPYTIILNHTIAHRNHLVNQSTATDVVVGECDSLHTTNDTPGMLCPTQPQWCKIETHESSKINIQRSPHRFPRTHRTGLSIREFFVFRLPYVPCHVPQTPRSNGFGSILDIHPFIFPIWLSSPNHGTQHSPPVYLTRRM